MENILITVAGGIAVLCFLAFSIYMTIVAVQILWPFAVFTACVSVTYLVIAHISRKDK